MGDAGQSGDAADSEQLWMLMVGAPGAGKVGACWLAVCCSDCRDIVCWIRFCCSGPLRLSSTRSSSNRAQRPLKGTIAKWLVRDFGFKAISSGDVLRAAARDGTLPDDVKAQASEVVSQGGGWAGMGGVPSDSLQP